MLDKTFIDFNNEISNLISKEYTDDVDGEIEMVAKLLNRSIKDKLEAEANDLNMMKKPISKLPL